MQKNRFLEMFLNKKKLHYSVSQNWFLKAIYNSYRGIQQEPSLKDNICCLFASYQVDDKYACFCIKNLRQFRILFFLITVFFLTSLNRSE